MVSDDEEEQGISPRLIFVQNVGKAVALDVRQYDHRATQFTVKILGLPDPVQYSKSVKRKTSGAHARKKILGIINGFCQAKEPIRPLLKNSREKVETFAVNGAKELEIYHVRLGARRLGEDTGRDILLNTTNLIQSAYEKMDDVIGKS